MFEEDSKIVMRNSDRMHMVLIGILVIAFALRLGWMLYARPEPVSDFEDYRQLAISILDHHQYGYPEPAAYRTPGYSVFLAGLMLISRSIFWLSFVNVALSTLACGLLYEVAYKLFGRQDIALTAALFSALNPAFVFYSPVLASEHLLVPLVLAATLLALIEGARLYLHALLAGLLLGVAVLVRGEALFYIPVVCGMFIWQWPQSLMQTVQRGVVVVSLVAVGTTCIILPWYVRNAVVIGKGVGLATNSVENFYAKHRPPEDEPLNSLTVAERHKEQFRLGLDYIKTSPSSLLQGAVIGTFRLYRPSSSLLKWSTALPRKPGEKWRYKPLALARIAKYLEPAIYGFLLSCAVLSLLTIGHWPRRAALVLSAFVFLNWVFYAVIFIAAPRYRYFVEFLFCIGAGMTVVRLISSPNRSFDKVCASGGEGIPSTSANVEISPNFVQQ